MSGSQRTWSKYKSSIDGPIRTRQDLYKNLPSVPKTVYGSIVDIRGEESYDETFTAGLQVKVVFDIDQYNNQHSNTWFPFDIDATEFGDKFADVASFKERLLAGDSPIRFSMKAKPHIHDGRAVLDTDLNHSYSSNSSYDAFSLSALMNGFGEQKKEIKRVMKPIGASKYKTAIEVKDGSIKLAATGKNFVQIDEAGISLNASSINMQCMPNSIRYGGFVSPQSPYLGMIPSNNFFPVAQYNLSLPIEGIASMGDIAKILASIVGT